MGQPRHRRAVTERSRSRIPLRNRRRGAAFALTILTLALTARSADGQGERASSAYLAPDHWSRTAIQRLAGLGLIDAGPATSAWPITRSRLRDELTAALSRARDPDIAAALDEWIERLDEESGLPAGPLRIAARIDLGYRSIEGQRIAGQLVPREGGDYDYPGSLPSPGVNRVDAGIAIDLNAGPFTIAATRNAAGDARGRTEALYALYGTRSVELWAGRRPLSFGRSRYDGIVLGPTARFDGFGIELPAGFRLPTFFRHLGEVRVSQTFARMDRSGPVDNPLFLGTRVSFAPSTAIAIGLNRAVIFGGAGNQDVTFERVFWMLLGQTDIGSKDSDFENQVASIDVLWRPGSSGWSLFGEYGFDDAGGAFFRVPAFTIGIRLARLPGLSTVGASAEFTHLASHCCGHPPWYQHGILAEGWSDRGVLLGHPVGGEGSEFAVSLYGDFARSRLMTEARVRLAHRGPENLLGPAFEGSAIGVDLYAMASLHRNLRLVFNLSGDRFRNGRDRHHTWIGLRGVF